MPDVLLELLTSKRFLVMIVSFLVYVGARVGLDVDRNEALALLVAVTTPWHAGQGLADHGKSRAEIEAAGAPPSPPGAPAPAPT